ncbi:MAG: enoyl-CoA hydratase-related protein, partial [Pseudomonadota bacterium]
MSDRLIIDTHDHVAHVRLNRPDKLNALDMPMFEALVAAHDHVAAMDGIRAVVVSGEGASFCSGLDVMSLMQSPDLAMRAFEPIDGTPCNFAQFAAMGLGRLPVPVIAAVHGRCYGGGLQIALGADMRIVAPDAELSVMEIRWGIIPDMAGSQLWRHTVREDIIRELIYTNRMFT